jgi:O-antigen/teichoic acid export membrane protein
VSAAGLTDAPSLSRPAAPSLFAEALRGAVQLGSSLAGAMAIGLFVRTLVPRALGPAAFGELRLAESAGDVVFVALGLGVDSVVRRELAVDPRKGRDVLWGLLALRLALGLLVVAGGAAVMAATHRSAAAIVLFAWIGATQVFSALDNTFAAVEHASGRVGWIARVNLSTRLVWAALVLVALRVRPDAALIAALGLVAELLRFALLTRRGVASIGVPARLRFAPVGAMLLAALPFFVNQLAHSLYARAGHLALARLGDALALGWYGAAANLAGIALLAMPLLSWVLVPAAARAFARSEEALGELTAAALHLTFLGSAAAGLFVGFAAPTLVTALFGPAFEGAVPAVRMLAGTFALASLSTIAAIDLLQRGRIRAVAALSLAGLALAAALAPFAIARGAAFGSAGAAAGAASTLLVSECAVAAILLALAWRTSWNASLRKALLAVAVSAAIAIGAGLASPLSGGLVRGAVALAVFAAVLTLLRAWPAAAIAEVRSLVRSRRTHVPSV